MTGQVALGFHYDASDESICRTSTFQTIQQLQGSVVRKLTDGAVVALELKRCLMPTYMLLDAGLYAPGRLTVPAWFLIGVTGATANSPLGTLEVEYEVELIGSQRTENGFRNIHSGVAYNGTVSVIGPTDTTLVGLALNVPAPNEPGWITYDGTTGTFTIPAWTGVKELGINCFLRMNVSAGPPGAVDYGAFGAVLAQSTSASPVQVLPDANYTCSDASVVLSHAGSGTTYCYIQFWCNIARPGGSSGDWTFQLRTHNTATLNYWIGTYSNVLVVCHIAELNGV